MKRWFWMAFYRLAWWKRPKPIRGETYRYEVVFLDEDGNRAKVTGETVGEVRDQSITVRLPQVDDAVGLRFWVVGR